MKTKSLILLCLILTVLIFVQANAYNAKLQEQDTIISQLQVEPQPTKESNRTTLNEPMTLIRSTEDYIYLNRLEIDRDTLESATKHTDINGVTWYEIIDDGYIKVYAEGHVMPDSIHWYSPY
jgi:hypothetical protein